MWRVVKTEFRATHYIKGHKICGEPHEHLYRLEVRLRFSGWIDFFDLEELIHRAIENFVNHDLGDMTAENLATLIRKSILDLWMNEKGPLANIEVILFENERFGVIA